MPRRHGTTTIVPGLRVRSGAAVLFPMDGLRVGVTGARKAPQLAAALERRGAIPIVGPLVTTDLPVPDEELLATTVRVLAAEPRWLSASTGTGMRLWADVAARHGRFDDLRRALAAARRVARGAKAVGGLAAFDLSAEHVTPEETDEAVVSWLADRASPGDRVAAQLHGGDAGAFDRLTDVGITVLPVRTYVAGRHPDDEQRARELVRAVAAGALDVVTFTSPGAARNLFEIAADLGNDVAADVNRALGTTVAVAVIGPVTGEVFRERGVPIAVAPARHRQGELVRALEVWSSSERPDRVTPRRHPGS